MGRSKRASAAKGRAAAGSQRIKPVSSTSGTSEVSSGRIFMLIALMPATPAWPPQSTPRLFLEGPLAAGLSLTIEGGQAHYLAHVLRMKPGAPLKICDDQTGEWLAEVTDVAKRDLSVKVIELLRPREVVPDLWLLAAPVKKARLDMVVEKACELGVALYRPVITRRTIVERMNMERLRATMVEAAEQCGRTALPQIEEGVKLSALLKEWPAERTLYFADETGGVPLAEVAGRMKGVPLDGDTVQTARDLGICLGD